MMVLRQAINTIYEKENSGEGLELFKTRRGQKYNANNTHGISCHNKPAVIPFDHGHKILEELKMASTCIV